MKRTNNLALFAEIRRLLLFAGSKVFNSHFTADGITALVEHQGKKFRIFVTQVEPLDRVLEKEQTIEESLY